MGPQVLVGRLRTTLRAAVVAAAVLVLAACSSAAPTERGEVHGGWQGTWTSSLGVGGAVNAQFVHEGGTLTGVVSITNSPCLVNGTVNGSVTGDNVAFGAVSGGHGIQFTARLGDATMTGSYSVSAGDCAGDTGTFQLTKLN